MPVAETGATLLAEIFPGKPNGATRLLEGWGPLEDAHCWTVGAQSRCLLPKTSLGPDCILVVDLKPYIDTQCPAQSVMLAIDDRLVATIQFSDQRALGFRLPAGLSGNGEHILSFTQLNSLSRRTPAGLDHHGVPLGVMVMSLRLYRLTEPPGRSETLEALPGPIARAAFAATAERHTGLSLPALAGRFECLGHDCEIGTVQRSFGAEPLGLLRFAGVETHRLAEGLRTGFAGVGAPATTRIFIKDEPAPEFKVHEQLYYLWYSTRQSPSATTEAAVHREQCRRFVFLQRKFMEDLHLGEKIFAVSRRERLMEAEALALYCALNLHARNTLLWTLPGDPALAGIVERTMPGFLRAHLGSLDPEHQNASQDAWLSVMVNAYLLRRQANAATAK
jgi:hypothetical protein